LLLRAQRKPEHNYDPAEDTVVAASFPA